MNKISISCRVLFLFWYSLVPLYVFFVHGASYDNLESLPLWTTEDLDNSFEEFAQAYKKEYHELKDHRKSNFIRRLQLVYSMNVYLNDVSRIIPITSFADLSPSEIEEEVKKMETDKTNISTPPNFLEYDKLTSWITNDYFDLFLDYMEYCDTEVDYHAYRLQFTAYKINMQYLFLSSLVYDHDSILRRATSRYAIPCGLEKTVAEYFISAIQKVDDIYYVFDANPLNEVYPARLSRYGALNKLPYVNNFDAYQLAKINFLESPGLREVNPISYNRYYNGVYPEIEHWWTDEQYEQMAFAISLHYGILGDGRAYPKDVMETFRLAYFIHQRKGKKVLIRVLVLFDSVTLHSMIGYIPKFQKIIGARNKKGRTIQTYFPLTNPPYANLEKLPSWSRLDFERAIRSYEINNKESITITLPYFDLHQHLFTRNLFCIYLSNKDPTQYFIVDVDEFSAISQSEALREMNERAKK